MKTTRKCAVNGCNETCTTEVFCNGCREKIRQNRRSGTEKIRFWRPAYANSRTGKRDSDARVARLRQSGIHEERRTTNDSEDAVLDRDLINPKMTTVQIAKKHGMLYQTIWARRKRLLGAGAL